MTKDYLANQDPRLEAIRKNFTYANYVAAKQWYLRQKNLYESNQYNPNANFPGEAVAVKNQLNTKAIIKARKKGNGRIVALNLANANRPLGAATFARHGTQEEYFAHNSSLFLDIYDGLENDSAKDAIMGVYFDLFSDDNSGWKKNLQISEKLWC